VDDARSRLALDDLALGTGSHQRRLGRRSATTTRRYSSPSTDRKQFDRAFPGWPRLSRRTWAAGAQTRPSTVAQRLLDDARFESQPRTRAATHPQGTELCRVLIDPPT